MIGFKEIQLTDKDFRRISRIIYQHCGINLHEGKKTLVKTRLAKRIRQLKLDSFGEYIDFINSPEGKEEFYAFVDSISTNLTCFFREKDHFEYLTNEFLPALAEKKIKQSSNRVRVWSAGCSSGEEPYSLGISLLESLPDNRQWDIKILASDVSTRILQAAKMGTYNPDRVSPLTATQKQRFLAPNRIEGQQVYQIRPALRNIIRFRYLNLMEPWPFRGPFDIIFCRNVMIYFDKATQETLVNRFWNCLDKGGLFCIGHSESLAGINHKYNYVRPAIYLKG